MAAFSPLGDGLAGPGNFGDDWLGGEEAAAGVSRSTSILSKDLRSPMADLDRRLYCSGGRFKGWVLRSDLLRRDDESVDCRPKDREVRGLWLGSFGGGGGGCCCCCCCCGCADCAGEAGRGALLLLDLVADAVAAVGFWGDVDAERARLGFSSWWSLAGWECLLVGEEEEGEAEVGFLLKRLFIGSQVEDSKLQIVGASTRKSSHTQEENG